MMETPLVSKSKVKKQVNQVIASAPVRVQVGRQGVTGNLLKSLSEVVEAHGMAKLKIKSEDKLDFLATVDEIREKSGLRVLKTVGRIAVLVDRVRFSQVSGISL